MKLTTLLFPAALLLGGAAVIPTTGAFAFVVEDDEYTDLLADYEDAIEIWKENIEKASKEERKQLRKEKPAVEFWPLFKDLADTGNGRAMLWMAENIRDAGVKASAREEILVDLYTNLFDSHINADWFGGALERLLRDKRTVGEELTLAMFEKVISNSESAENRSGALFQASSIMRESEDEKTRKLGEDYLAMIESKYAKTSWGKKVATMRAAELTQPGKMAPDFEGKTIDDFKFKLSDYKGKVVMLDFYGFW